MMKNLINAAFIALAFICISFPLHSLDCAFATVVTCGTSESYPAPVNNEANASNYDVSGCTFLWDSYDGNERLFYIDIGATPRDLTIEVSGLTADMDLFLFKNCNSHPGDLMLSNCHDASINGGTSDETVTLSFATGEYFFVIDGVDPGITSPFDLTVSCSVPGAPQACETGTILTCGDDIYVHSGGNNSYNNTNYDLTDCTHASYDYNGKDHLFDIELGHSYYTITIKMTGLSADLDMFLFKTCSDGGSVVFSDCVDFSSEGGTTDEKIIVHNAHGSYKLVIDGFTSGVTSSFTVSLDCNGSSSSSSCSDAKPLYCGESKWVSAPTQNKLDKNDYNLSHCSWGGYAFDGPEHLYKIDVGSSYKDLRIDLTGMSYDMDMILFDQCSYYHGTDLSSCIAKSARGGTSSEEIVVPNAHGVYYLVVEAADPWWSSGYEISVNCHTTHSNTCYPDYTLYCGDSYWINAPDYNSFDHYDLYGCTSYNPYYTGRDHLFLIDAGYSYEDLTIHLSGLSSDMDMILFRSCEDHYGLGELDDCIGYSAHSGSYAEEIVVPSAYGKYYLLVDSDDPWYSSGFEISVSCREPYPDPCEEAVPLYCGDSKWVYAPEYNHFDSYDFHGCSHYNYNYQGKDHLYVIHADGYGEDLKIKLSGFSRDLDMFLFRDCDNHYGLGELSDCIEMSRNSGYGHEEITIHGAYGTYYLAVDSEDPWYTSGYEITVECHYPQPDPCHQATKLYCGNWRQSHAPHYNSYDYRNYDYSYCYSGTDGPQYMGYDHLYLVDAGYTNSDLKIELYNMSADMDLLVYRYCTNDYGYEKLSHCVGYSVHSGYASEEVVIHNATGYYYIAVEAYDPWYSSGYDIKITCDDESSYSCDDATPLSCGDTKWVDASYDSYFDKDNYFLQDCSDSNDSYKGSDHFYKVNVGPSRVDLEVTLSNLSGDLDLLIFKACSDHYEEIYFGSCKDISDNPGTWSESVTVEDAKETYYIVVDAPHGNTHSGYSISINCTADEVPDPIDVPDDEYEEDPDEESTEPESLACGSTITGTTIDASSDFDNADILECYETSLLFTGGDVLIPFEKIDDEDVIELTMTQESENLSMFVLNDAMEFIDMMCRAQNFNSSKQRSNEDPIGEVYTDGGSLSAGTYYVLIEGYASRIMSDFTLSLACGHLCPPIDTVTCETLIEVIDSEGLTNDQSEYSNGDDINYVGYSGKEWSSLLIIDDSVDLTISLYDIVSDGDFDLFLIDSCESNVLLEASTNEAGLDESIEFEASPGSYVIVVDGWLGAEGSYKVEITGCTDPISAITEPAASARTLSDNKTFVIDHSVFPNPFSDIATIQFNVSEEESGSLELFNMAGSRLYQKDLILTEGLNEVRIAEELEHYQGLIIYRLSTGRKVINGTMIKVK